MEEEISNIPNPMDPGNADISKRRFHFTPDPSGIGGGIFVHLDTIAPSGEVALDITEPLRLDPSTLPDVSEYGFHWSNDEPVRLISDKTIQGVEIIDCNISPRRPQTSSADIKFDPIDPNLSVRYKFTMTGEELAALLWQYYSTNGVGMSDGEIAADLQTKFEEVKRLDHDVPIFPFLDDSRYSQNS
jgi:hypothetical protein